jgi:hypothetical protein
MQSNYLRTFAVSRISNILGTQLCNGATAFSVYFLFTVRINADNELGHVTFFSVYLYQV